LFFYTPFLLFLPVYLRRALAGTPTAPGSSPPGTPAEASGAGGAGSGRLGSIRHFLADRDRALTAALLAGIVAQLVVYSLSDWRGGTCYGPRYLADLLPLATWMLAPVVESLAALPLALFRWAIVFSVAVQAVGAFCYPRGASDLRIEAEHSRLPAYLIEAPAGIVTPGWVEWLRGR
ncbi:MAG TPA: hypothetical protein VN999_08290, partial [Thermoanaerobaculia bacterium]|nr:hypothetical protein [Thermoanaerobaculia bacterium]